MNRNKKQIEELKDEVTRLSNEVSKYTKAIEVLNFKFDNPKGYSVTKKSQINWIGFTSSVAYHNIEIKFIDIRDNTVKTITPITVLGRTSVEITNDSINSSGNVSFELITTVTENTEIITEVFEVTVYCCQSYCAPTVKLKNLSTNAKKLPTVKLENNVISIM